MEMEWWTLQVAMYVQTCGASGERRWERSVRVREDRSCQLICGEAGVEGSVFDKGPELSDERAMCSARKKLDEMGVSWILIYEE